LTNVDVNRRTSIAECRLQLQTTEIRHRSWTTDRWVVDRLSLRPAEIPRIVELWTAYHAQRISFAVRPTNPFGRSFGRHVRLFHRSVGSTLHVITPSRSANRSIVRTAQPFSWTDLVDGTNLTVNVRT